jgi:DNA-binding transcriptional LysR family regulator
MNWDDLRIFHAIAREGNLSAAGRRLKVSQTTIGRRLQVLEGIAGTRLFDKTTQGYSLTDAGRNLLTIVEEMVHASTAIDRWRGSISPESHGTVRIAAAGWMTRFLVRNHCDLVSGLDGISIEIVSGYGFVNLAQREADIAIRNRLPAEGRLVARRLADPAYAVYASADYMAAHPASRDDRRYGECDWIGYAESLSHLPSARWLSRMGVQELKLRCTSGLHILDAVLAGIGLGVLPCFVGEEEDELVRLAGRIDRDGASLWMVMHEDLKRVPRIRIVADRLVALFDRYSRELEASWAKPPS